jgi:hypothetical protein
VQVNSAGEALRDAAGHIVRSTSELTTGFADAFGGASGFAAASLSGLAAGTVASVARAGRVSVQQVASDAFGNALGESIAGQMNSDGAVNSSSGEIIDPATGEAVRIGRPYARSAVDDANANAMMQAMQDGVPGAAGGVYANNTIGASASDASSAAGESHTPLRVDPATGLASFGYTSRMAMRGGHDAMAGAAWMLDSRGTGYTHPVDDPVVVSAQRDTSGVLTDSYGYVLHDGSGNAVIGGDLTAGTYNEYTVGDGMGPNAGASNVPYVEQMANVSRTLHVGQGAIRNAYDLAVAGMVDPENSTVQKLVFGGFVAAAFPGAVLEEFGRGVLNIPSGLASIVPLSESAARNSTKLFDSSVPAEEKVLAGLTVLRDGSALVTNALGAAMMAKPVFEFGGPSYAPATGTLPDNMLADAGQPGNFHPVRVESKPSNLFGDAISTDWQNHESAVIDSLQSMLGRSVASKVYLRVETPSGEAYTVIPDALERSGSSFIIHDAKFSQSKDLQNFPTEQLRNTFTVNQKPAFDAISAGEANVKLLNSQGGRSLLGDEFKAGMSISVRTSINLYVNTSSGIVKRTWP